MSITVLGASRATSSHLWSTDTDVIGHQPHQHHF